MKTDYTQPEFSSCPQFQSFLLSSSDTKLWPGSCQLSIAFTQQLLAEIEGLTHFKCALFEMQIPKVVNLGSG